MLCTLLYKKDLVTRLAQPAHLYNLLFCGVLRSVVALGTNTWILVGLCLLWVPSLVSFGNAPVSQKCAVLDPHRL